MGERVTLKMVAEKAGVHLSTVSLALRGHPSIPVATQDRILAVAEDMGYRPDPVLSALVSYRFGKRKPIERGVLAWVDTRSVENSARHVFPTLWSGASDRAEALGWKLEEFCLQRQGLSPERFSRVLRTRNIVGVMVPPFPEAGSKLELEWPYFSAVTVCHTMVAPRLHSVGPDHMHNMSLLMQNLYALGYTRPGLVLERQINERTRHYWVAAFLEAQMLLPQSQRLPPMIRKTSSYDEMVAWYSRKRPDVIISSRPSEAIAALEAAEIKVPADVGVASPGLWPGETVNQTADLKEGSHRTVENSKEKTIPKNDDTSLRKRRVIAGINERFKAVGAETISLLVALINRYENGVPPLPNHSLIEGLWQPGETLRQCSAR